MCKGKNLAILRCCDINVNKSRLKIVCWQVEGKRMRSLFGKISAIIPVYGIVPLIFSVSFNLAVYIGTRMVAHDWRHYNIESPLDGLIPFWPPSVVVYLGCYLFWAVNYVLLARQDKEDVCKFFTADFISRVICMVFYLAIPTTNTRPQLGADGFWNYAMSFLYSVDAPDNLFPSIHCLVSWFCYAGIRKRKDIPGWYRGLSAIFAAMVCISTLTTKQHVILDVAGGVALAEICLILGKKKALWGVYEKCLDKVNGKLFQNRVKGVVHADKQESNI